jgi:hypothetical protein
VLDARVLEEGKEEDPTPLPPVLPGFGSLAPMGKGMEQGAKLSSMTAADIYRECNERGRPSGGWGMMIKQDRNKMLIIADCFDAAATKKQRTLSRTTRVMKVRNARSWAS